MILINKNILLSKLLMNLLVLLPFVLVFASEIFMTVKPSLSPVLKMGAMLYMFLYSFSKLKFHGAFIFFLLLFIPFFIYGILHSFNIYAAISEGVRYLFPVSVLMYGYAIKNHFKLLFSAFIIFVLINDFWQIINYLNWARGINQWFYNVDPYGNSFYNVSSGIIRATGIVAFFGLFGFINLIAFFLARKYYNGKRKNLILTIFIISLFLSFSYKTIGTLLLILFIQFKNKLKFFQIVGFLFVMALIIVPEVVSSMGESVTLRVSQYITEGDSARAESYRVMFAEMADFNLFGQGVGSFGGPESVSYHSPVYSKHHFNWYHTVHLVTTDTYYPHLFVEMGIIGGFLYLFILMSPLLLKWTKEKFELVVIIYFSLFIDTLFSYSLNNIAFLIVSLVFLYPLYSYNKEKRVNVVLDSKLVQSKNE